MTIYNEICKIEKLIHAKRNAANRLPCRMGDGVSFDDEYDADALKRDEVERLLENPAYDGNPVVQRMRDGESLIGILDKTLVQKTYGLRFLWGERKEFNKRVKPFREIVHRVDWHWLEQDYILNPIFCAETYVFYPVCLGYLIGSCLTLLGENGEGFTEHFKNPDALNLGGAALLGGIFYLFSLLMKKAHLDATSHAREDCKYIDNVLGRT